VPEDRKLLKVTALMRFADFPTIIFAFSIEAEPRRQSRHVFGVPMENRIPMTRLDGASEFPQWNEGCYPTQGGTLRNAPARGGAVTEFKTDLYLNSNDGT
jgi:hypothetical protein